MLLWPYILIIAWEIQINLINCIRAKKISMFAEGFHMQESMFLQLQFA